MPSTVGVVASNNCSPVLQLGSKSRFYSFEENEETIFTTDYIAVANGLVTTFSATSGGVETTPGSGSIPAGTKAVSNVYARYLGNLADNPSYYPTVTLTNAAGTVTKQ